MTFENKAALVHHILQMASAPSDEAAHRSSYNFELSSVPYFCLEEKLVLKLTKKASSYSIASARFCECFERGDTERKADARERLASQAADLVWPRLQSQQM
jgi:hypothetical protein